MEIQNEGFREDEEHANFTAKHTHPQRHGISYHEQTPIYLYSIKLIAG